MEQEIYDGQNTEYKWQVLNFAEKSWWFRHVTQSCQDSERIISEHRLLAIQGSKKYNNIKIDFGETDGGRWMELPTDDDVHQQIVVSVILNLEPSRSTARLKILVLRIQSAGQYNLPVFLQGYILSSYIFYTEIINR
jgi:hypothetical protein